MHENGFVKGSSFQGTHGTPYDQTDRLKINIVVYISIQYILYIL